MFSDRIDFCCLNRLFCAFWSLSLQFVISFLLANTSTESVNIPVNLNLLNHLSSCGHRNIKLLFLQSLPCCSVISFLIFRGDLSSFACGPCLVWNTSCHQTAYRHSEQIMVLELTFLTPGFYKTLYRFHICCGLSSQAGFQL